MMWNPPWSLAVVLPLGLLPGPRSAAAVAGGELRGHRLLRRSALAAPRRGATAALGRLGVRAGGDADAVRAAIGPDRTDSSCSARCSSSNANAAAGISPPGPRRCSSRSSRTWPISCGSRSSCDALVPRPVADRARRRGRGAGLRRGAAGRSTRTSGSSTPMRWPTARPSQWLSPTLGTLLRLAFGDESFRLQFVPVAVGLAWFAWHWSNATGMGLVRTVAAAVTRVVRDRPVWGVAVRHGAALAGGGAGVHHLGTRPPRPWGCDPEAPSRRPCPPQGLSLVSSR